MTKRQFILDVQHYRGGLESQKEIEAMENIFDYGVSRMLELTLEKKQFGVKKIANICTSLNELEQEEFCDWLEEKNWKATNNELELYMFGQDVILQEKEIRKEKKEVGIRKKYKFGGF